MGNISEVLPSEEALKLIYMAQNGTPRSKLEDMRIIAIYRTATDGYMIALFLMGGYRLMFMDKWRATHETTNFFGHMGDKNVKVQTKEIAQIIGAKLLMEAES